MHGKGIRLTARRSAALAMSGAAALSLTAFAAPAANAAATVVAIAESPLRQSVAAGQNASWGVAAEGPTPLTIVITWGDGTSKRFTTGTSWSGTVTHAFHPCAARSTTYTQRFTATDSHGNNDSQTTTVTVSYSGPLCS
jgi:hypothetical protein